MSIAEKIVITGDASDAEHALDSVAHKAKGVGNEMSIVSKRMAAVGTAAVAASTAMAAVYAVDKTKEFEKSISDLAAITGATGKDLDFLTSKAMEFGSQTTKSAAQAAEAFKLVASAKPDLLANAEALAAVTRETITLSEAAGTSLPESAATLGASLNQFNADAEESGRFINVLAAGAKFGASEISNTAEALKVSGTVAHSVGLSFEQTNAAIQALASVAIKGSEAGTGLRGVLLKLSTQSREEFNPEIVGFTQAIKNLAAAHLTTTEKAKLFGQESITAASALITQADSLDTLTGKLTDTDTAYEQARIRVNNLDGDLKILSSAMEAQAIMAGTTVSLSLRTLVQGFTDVISVEKQTTEETNKTKRNAQELAVVVGQVADVVGNAANGIAFPFEAVGGAIGALAAQLLAVTQGEFRQAINIGTAYADDMHQKLLDMSDPEISSRYEDIARHIIATNEELAASSKKETEAEKAKREADAAASKAKLEALKKEIEGNRKLAEAKAEAARVATIDKAAADKKAKELADAKAAADNIINLQQRKFLRLHDQALQASGEEETLWGEKYTREYDALRTQRKNLLALVGDDRLKRQELNGQFDTAEADLLTVHLDRLHKIEESKMSADEKLWKSGLDGKLQVTGKMLGQLSGLVNSKSRAMFETGKVAARSENAVNTYLSATKAYASLAGIPIVGPALGALAAAAAVAAGVGNDQKIAKQQFGGGSVSGGASVASVSGAGAGGSGGSSISGGTSGGSGDSGQGGGNVFNLNLSLKDAPLGTTIDPQAARLIGEHLAPYVQEAFDRGYGNRAVAG